MRDQDAAMQMRNLSAGLSSYVALVAGDRQQLAQYDRIVADLRNLIASSHQSEIEFVVSYKTDPFEMALEKMLTAVLDRDNPGLVQASRDLVDEFKRHPDVPVKNLIAEMIVKSKQTIVEPNNPKFEKGYKELNQLAKDITMLIAASRVQLEMIDVFDSKALLDAANKLTKGLAALMSGITEQ